MKHGLGPGPEFDLVRAILDSARPAASDGDPTTRSSGHASGGVGSAPPGNVELGPGDDCAVLGPGRIAVSTDLCVEGVHYRSDWIRPDEIGQRAVRAALSDLAAMAARPIGVLVSIAVDPERAHEWGPAVAAGMGEALAGVGAQLLGGDLSRLPSGSPAVIDVVAIGGLERPVSREGSRPGDGLWVTGTLGGAAAAVEIWRRDEEPPHPLRQRFVMPNPRIEEAVWLRDHVDPRAMIDLSDGIASDASHLSSAGQVRIQLDADRLPVDPDAVAALGATRARELALTGGEDYELLFTAPDERVTELGREFRSRFGIPLTRVGEVTSGAGLDILGVGTDAARAGFDHFRRHR